jgi:hypothetical protein
MVMYIAIAGISKCIAPQVLPSEVLEALLPTWIMDLADTKGYLRHTVGTYLGIGDQMPANHITIEILQHRASHREHLCLLYAPLIDGYQSIMTVHMRLSH